MKLLILNDNADISFEMFRKVKDNKLLCSHMSSKLKFRYQEKCTLSDFSLFMYNKNLLIYILKL